MEFKNRYTYLELIAFFEPQINFIMKVNKLATWLFFGYYGTMCMKEENFKKTKIC